MADAVALPAVLGCEAEDAVGFGAEKNGAVGELADGIDCRPEGGVGGGEGAQRSEVALQPVVSPKDAHGLVVLGRDPIVLVPVEKEAPYLCGALLEEVLAGHFVVGLLDDGLFGENPEISLPVVILSLDDFSVLGKALLGHRLDVVLALQDAVLSGGNR